MEERSRNEYVRRSQKSRRANVDTEVEHFVYTLRVIIFVKEDKLVDLVYLI